MTVHGRGLVCAGFVLLSAVYAQAQAISVLNPLAREYSLRSFAYKPPAGDGWREIGSAPDAVRLVYAEQLSDNQVRTRVDFVAQAFAVDDPAKVPDAFTLARMSMTQRAQEKGENLVGVSQLRQVPSSGLELYEYTIVAREGEVEFYENHFVALAPDKSEYLAAKLVTNEEDFRKQVYYPPFHDAIRRLRFSGASEESGEADGSGAGDEDETERPSD